MLTTDEIFARCAERRRAVADLVDSLTDEQLATPSLCGDWDVRTVAAHLTVPLVVPVPKFVLAMVRSAGNFDRANDRLARQLARRPVAELTGELRARAGSHFTPPGYGPPAPLTDLCVHTADLRVPLGLDPDITPAEAEVTLEFLHGRTKYFIPAGLLDGVAAAPDDLDRRWGAGAEVTGQAADIVLALLRGGPFLDRLTGPGRDLLAARLT